MTSLPYWPKCKAVLAEGTSSTFYGRGGHQGPPPTVPSHPQRCSRENGPDSTRNIWETRGRLKSLSRAPPHRGAATPPADRAAEAGRPRGRPSGASQPLPAVSWQSLHLSFTASKVGTRKNTYLRGWRRGLEVSCDTGRTVPAT